MNVELLLLRQLGAEVSELPLKPGAVLPARVLDRSTIVLAGARMAATLPDNLQPGQALRVRVREASHERLLLQVVEEPQASAEAAATPSLVPQVPTQAIPLPGGATARLLVEPDEENAGDGSSSSRAKRSSVTLRYESPGLGRLDLAVVLEPGALSAVAHASAEVADRLRSGAGELRESLGAATGRPARVDVIARLETFNVRA